MSVTKIFVFCKLIFKFSILIVIGCFEFANFFLKNENLINVIFFKGLDLNSLFSRILLLSILQLPFHIMISSSHDIFKFVSFFLKSNLIDFFLVANVIELKVKAIDFFNLIFKHELQLMNMNLIKFVTFHSLFLQVVKLNLKRMIHLT